MSQKNASFWDLEKPLQPGESCGYGSPVKNEAEYYADELKQKGFQVRVEQLSTIEHDLPNDDPSFREDQVFTSTRWCVIVVEQEQPCSHHDRNAC